MKNLTTLGFFFLQLFVLGQSANEISQRYYSDSEYKYFQFQDITSDYGPRASNHNFHGGLDVNDNSYGIPFVVDFTSTVEKIECGSTGLKSILFSNGIGYRHIFSGNSGDCPNNINDSTFSVNGFYFVNYNSSTNPKYAIITPYGKAFAEIGGDNFNFLGNPYTTTNSVIPNDIIAPIGNSGSYINSNGQEVSYHTHLHIQKTQSFTPTNGSLWSDVNSDNVLAEFNYQNNPFFNGGYSISLESQNGSTFSNVRGNNNYPIKAKVTFANPGTILNSSSQQRYLYCVFDPELIELELKPSDGNYSIIQGVNNWAEISYGGNGSTPIPSNVGGSGSQYLGNWTNTGVEPKAYGSGSYDDYYFTQFIPRVTNGGQDAQLSNLARYPDGNYHLRAVLTDVQDQEHFSEEAPIIIDNFNPHIKNVEVTFSAQEVYNKGWELNSQSNGLELTGVEAQYQINPGDQFDLVVTASEPMLFVRVKVDDPSTGFTNMVGSPDGKSWGLSMFYTGTINETDLVFQGEDINGNSILGTNQIEILSEHPIPNSSGRQASSNNTLIEDRSHKLNSSRCSVTANAGSNVTIQNGESTTLQGSGGTSCSWSPSTGLSNPNSCTPTATPSQTTIYTLTVTENGCTDTDQVTITVDGTTGGNPPPNDDCNNATTLTSNTSCNYTNGTVEDATPSVGANSCLGCECESPDDYDVYYKFTAIATSHTVTVGNYASNFDAVIELRTSCSSGSSNYIGCYDPIGAPSSVSETWNGLTIGQTYYIRVFEWNYQGSPPSTDTFKICVTHQETNTNGIDLVSNITGTSNNNPDVGDTITIDYTVTNNGDEATQFWLTPNIYLSTDTILNGSDDNMGSELIPQTIAPNETISLSTEISIPNVVDGQYYLVTDPDPVDIINESNENNNLDFYPIQIGDVVQNGPDLDVRRVRAVPDIDLVPGQEVELEILIENEGTEDVNDFEVLVFLDIDDDGDPDTNELMGTFTFNGLDVDEDETVFEEFDLPTYIPSAGTYDLIVFADSDNQINEPNENNNYDDDRVTIALASSNTDDVTILNESVTQTNVNAGGTINVAANHIYLGNQTSSDLPTLTLGYFLSTDCNFSYAEDVFLDDDTSNLGINNPNIDEDNILTIPPATPSGTYYILFVADSENLINEGSLENNNVACVEITINGTSTPEGDIFITDETCNPYNVMIGSEVEVFANMNYSGIQLNADLPSIEVFYFLSTDCVLSNDDILVSDDGISLGSDLPVNDVTESIELPNNLNPGTYYIITRVDVENGVYETNENNNISCVEFNLFSANSNYQDVTLSYPFVDVTEANLGDQIYISVFQNYTGYQTDTEISSPRVYYYLSTDCILDSNDYYLEDDPSGIGSDDPSEFEYENVTIPSDISIGNYYILFVADAEDIIVESNENNNLECIPITITDDTLGIIDNELNNHIKIYPNPVKDILTINLGENHSKVNIKIHNVLGQKVMNYEFENKQVLEINTSSFSNGMYFLNIKTDDNKTKEFKIIKE
ncbi:T9SS type A sorting domain-containing protein [Lacinutrix sp. WUR7]|uniref:T9SS type A sorting domain-containing protein n=1 Tax=Lacinutrix sp. WUR7 TaxID=2653681 RepID=UPI00193CDDB1|nr:CARDB domain-containing protein [Lacinutrix sp. WUR7]QRM89330.1 T9SS type A sorting domain-containing protein [Lacinutrix sp. WUR7]